MKKIEFTGYGSCTAISDFGPGDVARVDDRLAAHLVEEVGCAKYADPPPAPAAVEQPKRARGRR